MISILRGAFFVFRYFGKNRDYGEIMKDIQDTDIILWGGKPLLLPNKVTCEETAMSKPTLAAFRVY